MKSLSAVLLLCCTLVSLMAMELATAHTAFTLFQNGRGRDAVLFLRSNQKIGPKELAAIDGIQHYFHYLSQVRHLRFRASTWPQTIRNWSQTSTVRAVMESDCDELKTQWRRFAGLRHDMVNAVQAIYILSLMDYQIKIYNAGQQADNPRVQQELADVGAQCLDMDRFNRKVRQLRQAQELASPMTHSNINISRFHLLETAEPAIMQLSVNEAKARNFSVKFRGEPGIDAGGPMREFFSVVSRTLFNPDMALFNFSAGGNYSLQVHPLSTFKREEWHLYRFAGRFLAMAILHKQPIGTRFSSAFYKHILGHPLEAEDLKDIDETVYDSVQYVIDNDPEVLMLNFVVAKDEFGQRSCVELKPGGADIDVTEENKAEYVHLLIQYHTTHLVAEQMERIRQGFFEIIPRHLISVFSCSEFRFLLSGLTQINVADWKANTAYENCDAGHQVVVMFWDMVEHEMDNTQRADLLQFVTGSRCVPVTGFKDLQGSNGEMKKFALKFDSWSASPAIVSHTCFNQLCIPRHSSRAQFREYMMQALLNKEGFGDI